MISDYVIVGSGLTGAVIARILRDAGKQVVVLERRNHLGGNVHDFVHPSGIRIHTYGPHYFRTSSEKIWDFVNRFSSFDRFEAVIKSLVDGRYENWPIARSYINALLNHHWVPTARCGSSPAANFESACLQMMPREIYEKFIKGYTEKQWGVPAHTLSASLAGRFEIHEDDEPRLKRHRFQGIPSIGYAAFMEAMLAGIPVLLNFDYHQYRGEIAARRLLVFTGPIDEYFGYRLGRLAWRGQTRVHTYLPNVDYVLPCAQVNNPAVSNGLHIRTLEWKHMMPPEFANRIRGTVLTRETPITPQSDESCEYPFPDDENQKLLSSYQELAAQDPGLLICGRLGEYRYYDMDQAIGRAMMLADRILAGASVQKIVEVSSKAEVSSAPVVPSVAVDSLRASRRTLPARS